MNMYYPHLFSPLKIGNKQTKNRITCSPQSAIGAEDASGLTQRGFEYYLEKAKGGAGIVTVGETQLLSDFFQAPNPDEMAKYCLLTEMMKDYGALTSIEIGHRGEEDYVFEKGAHVEGVCAKIKEPFGVIVDEIDEKRMEELVTAYANAAEVSLQCGFDMIMLHGGHTWLLAQFMSPLFNKRTDKFGGSVENRARFPLMVIDGIRERVGNKLLIDYRMSADEIMEGGVHIDEMVQFSKMLESHGVDIIHASVGTHLDPWCYTFNSIYHKNGCNLPLADAIKKAVSIPVVTIGGFNTPEQCEEAIASGKADLVCMGRQHLADPHFAEKAEKGEADEINTCIRCMCCHNAPVPPTYCNCTVNPIGNKEYVFNPAATCGGKKVLVIGGGIGGLSAANRAYDKGHDVILVEKTDRLGGALSFTDVDVYKGDLKHFRDNMISRTQRKNIDIRLNTEATAELIEREKPDLVICAIGAERAVPPIKGIEKAVHAIDAYGSMKDSLGDNIVIVGGGLIGCELAMHLSTLGKKLTIIEMQHELAPEGYRLHRQWLLQRLELVADCHTDTRCLEFRDDGVLAMNADGEEVFFRADTVLYALGMKSRTAQVEALRQAKCRAFVSIGDCKRPAKVKEAVHEGFFAADNLK